MYNIDFIYFLLTNECTSTNATLILRMYVVSSGLMDDNEAAHLYCCQLKSPKFALRTTNNNIIIYECAVLASCAGADNSN